MIALGASSLTFEMIYPVIEHTFAISLSKGFIFIPYSPSGVNINVKDSSNLSISDAGTNVSYDTSRLFPGHFGRKLFSLDLSWDMVDVTFINQMRMFEQMNFLGYSVAIRPQHPDLPPVMIGDIKVQSKNPSYDYQVNDLKVSFDETT